MKLIEESKRGETEREGGREVEMGKRGRHRERERGGGGGDR